MSRFIDISITGDRRLAKKFNKMQISVQKKVMKNAARKALQPVLQLAKAQAPIGDTGRLNRFIKIATFRGKWGVGAVVQSGTRKQLGISSDAAFYYPSAHEFGTRHITPPPGGFLRSSMARRKRVALGILRTEIKQLMAKV